MLPVLGPGANALQVIPRTPDEIRVGDIISFSFNGKIVSHRVISIGEDSQGWYAITQGDNNPDPGPLLVRFEQIDRVLVAILY